MRWGTHALPSQGEVLTPCHPQIRKCRRWPEQSLESPPAQRSLTLALWDGQQSFCTRQQPLRQDWWPRIQTCLLFSPRTRLTWICPKQIHFYQKIWSNSDAKERGDEKVQRNAIWWVFSVPLCKLVGIFFRQRISGDAPNLQRSSSVANESLISFRKHHDRFM